METLRHRAVRGGAVLAGRQALSLLLNLAGTIALTRILGPSGYGRFAAALGISSFLFQIGQMGLNAWLLRRPEVEGESETRIYQTVRTLLVLNGVVLAAVGLAALPLIARWVRDDGVAPLTLWLLLGLPLQLANLVPLSQLERSLSYAAVAMAELQGLVLNVVLSVGLAWAGLGELAMVLGWWGHQAWLFVRFHRASDSGFTFAFDASIARIALRDGLAYASSLWLWQLKDLVNPLIVARWAGVDGAGVVALGARLVEAASVVKTAAWRIALPTLARLRDDRPRLALAVRDGTRLQLLGVGPALLLLLVSAPLIPSVLGDRWRPVIQLLPFIAAGVAANASVNLRSSALYAIGRAGAVAWHHAAFVLLFAGAAWTLVPLFGVTGYGLAELAALPAYLVLTAAFGRAVGGAERAHDWVIAASLVLALAAYAWTPWSLVILLIAAAMPSVRAGLLETVNSARRGLLARAGA